MNIIVISTPRVLDSTSFCETQPYCHEVPRRAALSLDAVWGDGSTGL